MNVQNKSLTFGKLSKAEREKVVAGIGLELYGILDYIGVDGSNEAHYFSNVVLKEVRENYLAGPTAGIDATDLDLLLAHFREFYLRKNPSADFKSGITIGVLRDKRKIPDLS